MPKQTLQEKGAQMLLDKGFEELPRTKTKKYRVFKNPQRENILYFVGKKGAIRAGKNVGSSYSLGKVKR